MYVSRLAIGALGLSLVLAVQSSVLGQTKEDTTVRESIGVFSEVMAIPANGIPRGLLEDAHGVAIIPSVIKGSFVVGARFGHGVLMVRDDNGGWHAPVFINLTGGNIGWQVGVQSTDVVLVFKTKQSVNGLLSGKFTIGADAAAAAGPLGRQATAATDGRLAAEIYSYSRSRGLFAGVSLDGSVIQMDAIANATYYRSPAPGQPVIVPEAAQQLVLQVVQYTGTQVPPAAPAPTQTIVQPQPQTQIVIEPQPVQILAENHSIEEVNHCRDQLAKFAPELYELLDPSWQTYLALPAEVFTGNGHPSIEVLNGCLQKFETVRTDPRYAALAERAEFQSTYGLLRHYILELGDVTHDLMLPSPPTVRVGSR